MLHADVLSTTATTTEDDVTPLQRHRLLGRQRSDVLFGNDHHHHHHQHYEEESVPAAALAALSMSNHGSSSSSSSRSSFAEPAGPDGDRLTVDIAANNRCDNVDDDDDERYAMCASSPLYNQQSHLHEGFEATQFCPPEGFDAVYDTQGETTFGNQSTSIDTLETIVMGITGFQSEETKQLLSDFVPLAGSGSPENSNSSLRAGLSSGSVGNTTQLPQIRFSLDNDEGLMIVPIPVDQSSSPATPTCALPHYKGLPISFIPFADLLSVESIWTHRAKSLTALDSPLVETASGDVLTIVVGNGSSDQPHADSCFDIKVTLLYDHVDAHLETGGAPMSLASLSMSHPDSSGVTSINGSSGAPSGHISLVSPLAGAAGSSGAPLPTNGDAAPCGSGGGQHAAFIIRCRELAEANLVYTFLKECAANNTINTLGGIV